MDDDTTFDERVREVRERRRAGGESGSLSTRPDPAPVTGGRNPIPGTCLHPGCTEPAEPGSSYCRDPNHTLRKGVDTTPDIVQGRSEVDPFGGDTDDDEIAQLRRDISRLEGKVDALLAALEIENGDH